VRGVDHRGQDRGHAHAAIGDGARMDGRGQASELEVSELLESGAWLELTFLCVELRVRSTLPRPTGQRPDRRLIDRPAPRSDDDRSKRIRRARPGFEKYLPVCVR